MVSHCLNRHGHKNVYPIYKPVFLSLLPNYMLLTKIHNIYEGDLCDKSQNSMFMCWSVEEITSVTNQQSKGPKKKKVDT
jgi:hypothetical protein